MLRDLIRDPVANDIDAATIMAVTAEYFGVTLDELCGPVKTKQIASARQIAMYLCRELTDLTLPKIGQTFGGRDHTTVMHADKKIRTETRRAPADLRPRPGAHRPRSSSAAGTDARTVTDPAPPAACAASAASARSAGTTARGRGTIFPTLGDTQPLVVSAATLAAPPSDLVIVTDRAPVTLGAISSQRVEIQRLIGSRSHHLGVADLSPSVAVRAHFTHIWGQLCGQSLPGRWMNARQIRGQLVDRPGTTRAGAGLSTAHRPVHGPVPTATHRPPRRASLPGRRSIHTIHSPFYYCWISLLSKNEEEQRRWMERSRPPGTPRPGPGPEMTPVGRRLYGGRTGSARAGRRSPPHPVPPVPSRAAIPTSPSDESSRQEHP